MNDLIKKTKVNNAESVPDKNQGGDEFMSPLNPSNFRDDEKDARLKIIKVKESHTKKEVVVPVLPLV